LVTDQLVALDTLAWFPDRLAACTLCGTGVPVVPVPRCGRCGGLSEPYEGTWQCGDESTGRALAMAFCLCHGHLCRVERAAVWRVVDTKLRKRYGLPEEKTP